jgi:Tol biopolymer transport system component
LTTGAGAFIEPRASADGRRLACTAQRVVESLVIIDAEGTDQAGPFAVLTGRGAGDSEPSRAPGDEAVVFQSRRSGSLNLWRTDPPGGSPSQVTVGPAGDHHPSVSPDRRQVAFISARGGHRAIWIGSVEGGAPRALVEGPVLDQLSWSPDGTRIVYAMAGPEEPSLWIAPVDGKAPSRIPGVSGALPAWSPTSELIAYVARSGLEFTTSTGQPVAVDVRVDPTLANRFAWSDDGRKVALTSAPGANTAEVWVVDIGPPARKRRVALLPSRYTLNGVAWRRDSRSLIVGLADHDNQILLLDGVR